MIPRSARRGRVEGPGGAAATAHPLATAAALGLLDQGGSAVDAAVGAQAVLCVSSPQSCGLGGDVLALVHVPGQPVLAVNGVGRSARRHGSTVVTDGAASATVPGIVAGWETLHRRWGRLAWDRVLAPALGLAEDGVPIGEHLAAAVESQRPRLERGGAAQWDLLRAVRPGQAPGPWRQPELADLLRMIARRGAGAFYGGAVAAAIARSVAAGGGGIDEADLARHGSILAAPVTVGWRDALAHVQPPSSQGVLLALALRAVERDLPPGVRDLLGSPARDHLLVEVTNAAFASRDDAHDAESVLTRCLSIDPERASRRGGPRSYLHTAGVAVADAAGSVVSCLISVFDAFGSATFVPEHGFTLNNRAGGFTAGANAPRPGAYPVHTLAPALLVGPHDVRALATPGADGQVQTLLQVLARERYGGVDVAEAVAAPRWRGEDGALLIEAGHPAAADLLARGHDLRTLAAGDGRFGSVVVAGHRAGRPYAVADWRRNTDAGALAQ